MNTQKPLVLDANILIRAVLGRRVRQILRKYADRAEFCAPETCFAEAHKYVPGLARRKGMSVSETVSFMEELELLVRRVDQGLYRAYEQDARRRMERRDSDDWPVAALALLLRCPIWTEDQDFFGSGIAIWNTDLVELYLRQDS